MEDLLLRRRALMSANDGKLYIVRNGVLRPQYNDPYIAGQRGWGSASHGVTPPTVISEGGLYKITPAKNSGDCVVFRPEIDLSEYTKICADGEFYAVPTSQISTSLGFSAYIRVPTGNYDYFVNTRGDDYYIVPGGTTAEYIEVSLTREAGFPAMWFSSNNNYSAHAYIRNLWLE